MDERKKILESYKKKAKENIAVLINSGYLSEAKELIKEYEQIIPNDFDLFSIKSVIAIKENNLDEAEKIINEGLLVNNNDPDLLFNKGYVLEQKGNLEWATFYHKKAQCLTDSEDNIIDRSIQVLIGSPVRQKPQILEKFLISLNNLIKDENVVISYAFIDDNYEVTSSDLLKKFSESVDRTVVFKANSTSQGYKRDNYTHFWNDETIWKVAYFKNFIIQYALENDFDYLFLVDSDLILHPETLRQLLSSKKDIISNIFWTRWTPETPELPQVWLKDTYIQYDFLEGEKLTEDQILLRQYQFLQTLKQPGIYEVGGLGACTLISKNALRKGVNFNKIQNLSFWGEDRHFCVRAAALGFKLYVDTHYPAYHIYRDTDLHELHELNQFEATNINIFKKKITLVFTNFSGSNTVALFKLLPDKIRKKYNVLLINHGNDKNYKLHLMLSDVVVITEGNYYLKKEVFNKKQKIIDLWHGFPLKSMGYSDSGEQSKDLLKEIWSRTDYITSYSELFNELMNKCINIPIEKYIVTGAPRNDFLFMTNGKRNLINLFGHHLEDKNIIIYMPTYRYNKFRKDRKDGDRGYKNIFDFPDFKIDSFKEFLRKNNLVLIIKLHPAEESLIGEKIKSLVESQENIFILWNDLLEKNQIDLYELLNGIDLLITDYSSVYFDYLLLDRPIIFTPIDIAQYTEGRGLLLSPYEKWTPGPKVYDQASLEKEIIKCLNNSYYYAENRENICSLVHAFKDGKSSMRVWSFIENIV